MSATIIGLLIMSQLLRMDDRPGYAILYLLMAGGTLLAWMAT